MFCQNALLSLTRDSYSLLCLHVPSEPCPSVTHLQAKNHLCFQYWWKKLMSYRSLLLLHKSVTWQWPLLYHLELGKNNSAVSWPTANHCYHGRWYLVLNVLQCHRSYIIHDPYVLTNIAHQNIHMGHG